MVKRLDAGALHISVWIALLLLLAFLTREVATAPDFIVTADLWFENLLLSVRTPLLSREFAWITPLGSVPFVIGGAGVVGLFLWRSKIHRAYAFGLAATLLGAAVTGYAMKALVGRARPSGLIPSMIETSSSFPSGHATAAMALYGFLAYFLCALFPERKAMVLTAAALLIGIIGFSRLYLGVHFPSDVLAGYLVGGLCLLLGIAITKRMRRAELTVPN